MQLQERSIEMCVLSYTVGHIDLAWTRSSREGRDASQSEREEDDNESSDDGEAEKSEEEEKEQRPRSSSGFSGVICPPTAHCRLLLRIACIHKIVPCSRAVIS